VRTLGILVMVAGSQPLQRHGAQDRLAGGDVGRVAALRPADRRGRPVDGDDPAAHQPLAEQPDRGPRAATDLRQLIVTAGIQQLHRPPHAFRGRSAQLGAPLFSIAWQQMVTHGTRSMCPTALLPLLACPILATTSM
jgi:hypothetical protein